MTCHSCLIAGYLGESGEADGIRDLVHMWHDKCTGCDCEVKPCERGILSFLRSLWHSHCRVHVPRLPGRMGKKPCT